MGEKGVEGRQRGRGWKRSTRVQPSKFNKKQKF